MKLLLSQNSDQQNECVECETKISGRTSNYICNLQESADTEPTDENIEFAVELFMEQWVKFSREVQNDHHHHTARGAKRDERKIESLLRNFEAVHKEKICNTKML